MTTPELASDRWLATGSPRAICDNQRSLTSFHGCEPDDIAPLSTIPGHVGRGGYSCRVTPVPDLLVWLLAGYPPAGSGVTAGAVPGPYDRGITRTGRFPRTDRIFAVLIVISLIGLSIDVALRLVRERAGRWAP